MSELGSDQKTSPFIGSPNFKIGNQRPNMSELRKEFIQTELKQNAQDMRQKDEKKPPAPSQKPKKSYGAGRFTPHIGISTDQKRQKTLKVERRKKAKEELAQMEKTVDEENGIIRYRRKKPKT